MACPLLSEPTFQSQWFLPDNTVTPNELTANSLMHLHVVRRSVWFVTLDPQLLPSPPPSPPAHFPLWSSWLCPLFSYSPSGFTLVCVCIFSPLHPFHWPPSSTFQARSFGSPGGNAAVGYLIFSKLVLLKYASSLLCVHTCMCVKAEQTTPSFTHTLVWFTVPLSPSLSNHNHKNMHIVTFMENHYSLWFMFIWNVAASFWT